MNKTQAIEAMKKDKQVTTGMLKALGLPFEAFLVYSQKSKEERELIVNAMIIRLEA